MKRIILTLVVLLVAAPAIAAVDVNCSISDANVLTIDFTNTDANKVRAFALDVSVVGANISSTGNYSAGYWVYPTNIVIAGGVVTNYGTPIAASTASTMTAEMGSLYASNDPCAAHQSAPAQSGALLTAQLSASDAVVTITKNVQRGSVVMEDASDSGWSSCTCTAGCGTCPLDISGASAGVPDGFVGPEDMSYMLNLLSGCSAAWYYCDVTGLTAAEACMDVSGASAGVPDGYVGPEDMSYMLNMLSGCSANWYYCACP